MSVTLITRNDWRITGELIKILERAHQSIPEDHVAMAGRYKQINCKKKWKKIGRDPRNRIINVYVESDNSLLTQEISRFFREILFRICGHDGKHAGNRKKLD